MPVVPTKDLPEKLSKYKKYLVQVEILLDTQPTLEDLDLQELKEYLKEVIETTTKLLEPSGSGVQLELPEGRGTKRTRCGTAIKWKIGDTCKAPWSEDGMLYEAVIESITEEDICTVRFVNTEGEPGISNFVFSHFLRPFSDDDVYPVGSDIDVCGGSLAARRRLRGAERRQRKKTMQAMAKSRKILEKQRSREIEKFEMFLSGVLDTKDAAGEEGTSD